MKELNYLDTVNVKQLVADYPLGSSFLKHYQKLSRDEIREQQNKKFIRCLNRAWDIPFYQRHWGNAGIEPGDITSLDDIDQLPPFSKSDLMASVAEHPPFGDYHGWDDVNSAMVFHTTSGTTGRPQPLFFSPKSREVQALLLARIYRMQGIKARDVVHSVYGHGMINGGHYVREAVLHYTQALFMSAGTGVETRSIQQVDLMRDFGANVIVGFADYINKLAQVAREMGLEPGVDIPVKMISGHMGQESRQSLSAAWGGAACYDWYGVGDTGAIAGEGPDRDGLYIMEDAQFVEIADINTHKAVSPGDKGDMIVTCLYKDDIYPIIRFNTHDVTSVINRPSSLDLNFQRIAGFLGRSDNMVKIRGINIFPHAVGNILSSFGDFNGEFICTVDRDDKGREEMLVQVESQAESFDTTLIERYQSHLRQHLGIEPKVTLVPTKALASLTQIETRQKPIRLIDKRKTS